MQHNLKLYNNEKNMKLDRIVYLRRRRLTFQAIESQNSFGRAQWCRFNNNQSKYSKKNIQRNTIIPDVSPANRPNFNIALIYPYGVARLKFLFFISRFRRNGRLPSEPNIAPCHRLPESTR